MTPSTTFSTDQKILFWLTLRSFHKVFVRYMGSSILTEDLLQNNCDKPINVHVRAGFPGAAGCIDCMKLHRKFLPFIGTGSVSEQRLFQVGHDNLRGMGDRDVYCCHWFAGRPGTKSDMNFLSIYPLLRDSFDCTFKFRTVLAYKITLTETTVICYISFPMRYNRAYPSLYIHCTA